MGSTALADHGGPAARSDPSTSRLLIAWQDPASRRITPVARLERRSDGEDTYEFRYLRSAVHLERFRPFVGFPDVERIYRSSDLFPFFENRLMPRTRADYSEFVSALGLEPNADPFEVLALSEGRRQTDTIEVFPEPVLANGVAQCRFLVRGVRHVPRAQEAIDSLAAGDHLSVVPDPQNPEDRLAVLLRDGDFHLLGWVPAYLTSLISVPLGVLGPDAVDVTVEHIGDRKGPSHLRLLCRLAVQWPSGHMWPFDGGDFG